MSYKSIQLLETISYVHMTSSCCFSGNEGMPQQVDPDTDSGKGSTMASYNSANSLNDSTTTLDSPEQFEELKQKKETIVAGIEL